MLHIIGMITVIYLTVKATSWYVKRKYRGCNNESYKSKD